MNLESNFIENSVGEYNINGETKWWTDIYYDSAYEIIKDRKAPVFIPTYNRFDPVTVKTLFADMTPELNYPVFLVVRESQVEKYKENVSQYFGIKILSFPDEEINNLGAVRRHIVDFIYDKGFTFGFMFDDDIIGLSYTIKGYTGAGDPKADYIRKPNTSRVLAMWQLAMEYAIDKYDLSASAVSPMFSSWKFDYTNPEESIMLYRGIPSQVMCINAKNFKKHNLVYPDTKDVAHEDIDMAIKIVEKDAKLALFPFLVYSALPMTPEFGNFGDTMEKRMKAQQDIMYKNHSDKNYVRFSDKRGLAQVSINWIRVRKKLGVDSYRFNLWNHGDLLK